MANCFQARLLHLWQLFCTQKLEASIPHSFTPLLGTVSPAEKWRVRWQLRAEDLCQENKLPMLRLQPFAHWIQLVFLSPWKHAERRSCCEFYPSEISCIDCHRFLLPALLCLVDRNLAAKAFCILSFLRQVSAKFLSVKPTKDWSGNIFDFWFLFSKLFICPCLLWAAQISRGFFSWHEDQRYHQLITLLC